MMRFQIGQKPLRLRLTERFHKPVFLLTVAAVIFSISMTGCGKKYEAIDLTEFEAGKIIETTAGETDAFSEREETEAALRTALKKGGTEGETAASETGAESDIAVQAEVVDTGRTAENDAPDEMWNGHVVAIDAGHQAKANTDKEPIGPGAETMKAKMEEGSVGTTTGLEEHELTLATAKKLELELKERGYQVVMLRESNDVNLSNAERSVIANKSGAEILLRLHANSMENSSVYGVLTMCMTEYNPYNASLHAESYALSKKIVDQIGNMTGTRNRGVQQVDNLSAINWSEIPVSVIEMGFLSNPDEERWLESEEYQDKIISGIAAAVDSYFEE